MTEIRIVVPGACPRKNDRTRTRIVAPKSGRAPFIHYHPTKAWEEWVERLRLEAGRLPKIDRGAWSLRVWQYVDKARHLDGETLHVALGDVDSSTSAVLDGLQAIGAIDDDARFVDERATKHIDRANPRIEILLTLVESETPQLDLTATITPTPARARATKRAPKTPKPTDPRTLDDF